MFISVTFPFADYRGLHKENAGRLERPCWGNADPRASFAKGFGSIHTRMKSSNGFSGENYYADCNNIIKYPSQIFVQPLINKNRAILVYPVYRRFFFDGQISGRYELGFRLNEDSIYDIEKWEEKTEYDIIAISKKILESEMNIKLLDGRIFFHSFYKSMAALRDGYILSSTQNNRMKAYDVESIGSTYVSVGSPFIFIRSSPRTEISKVKQKRNIVDSGDTSLFLARSGVHGQHFDIVVMPSKGDLDAEAPNERLIRLFYTQIRTLTFAHSYYLKQVDAKKLAISNCLEPAVEALIERLKNLAPVNGDAHDRDTCDAMRKIIHNMDIDPLGLAKEIEKRLKKGRVRKQLSRFFKYFDDKADKAIEAAASAATKHLLNGGS